MATGILPVISKLRTSPAWESSAFGESSSGSSNISAITATPVHVAKAGGLIVALIGRHTNWINSYTTKTVTSDQRSTFTEIPSSDTVRGPSGQRNGHVILFYCQNPVIGEHTLTGNVTASQSLAGLRICASFASNVGGYRNLATQSTTGSAAVNLAITASAGSLTYMGLGENGAATGINWTDLSASGDLVDRAGTLGLVAADGTVTYTSSSTQGVCAAGVELYPA